MATQAPGEPSDQTLVKQMASGSTDALHVLNRRYANALFALARRILGNESDAEEVAADSLWQAWRSAANYDPARGSVGAWLTTIARSRTLDRLRAEKSRSPRAQDAPPPATAEPDAAYEVELTQRRQALTAAVAELPTQERSLLELAYFSDLSHSEIADRLKLPLGTVKTRIRSAMIKLRHALVALRDAESA